MTTRSRETPATFTRPFALSGVDRPLPAGTYCIVVDEEDIPGLSFLAFRRTATMLHLPAVSKRGGVAEVFLVDPDENSPRPSRPTVPPRKKAETVPRADARIATRSQWRRPLAFQPNRMWTRWTPPSSTVLIRGGLSGTSTPSISAKITPRLTPAALSTVISYRADPARIVIS